MANKYPVAPPLGGLAAQIFLDEYWQKKPLLIREAFTAFTSPISSEELAGLACEADIESRLIIRDTRIADPKDQWTVRHGPFTDADFSQLPETDWTLLVQDVDKWVPEAAALLQRFRFIPDWRVDDLMISHAEPGGSVGAHWDNYDVFLIQGSGQRRWQIDERPIDPENLLHGPAIRLLREFHPTRDWVLEPGDMLYLPPQVAHHGVAVGSDCQTLSVGFRAPSHTEILEDFTRHLLEQIPPDARYSDMSLQAEQHPAEINTAALDHFRAIVEQYLHPDRNQLQDWLGEYLTRPKPGIGPYEPAQPVAVEEIAATLAQNNWSTDGASRFAFSVQQNDNILIFVNGESTTLGPEHLELIQSLCLKQVLDGKVLSEQSMLHPEIHELLHDLINQGHLHACN